jgi:hypothetical protein
MRKIKEASFLKIKTLLLAPFFFLLKKYKIEGNSDIIKTTIVAPKMNLKKIINK